MLYATGQMRQDIDQRATGQATRPRLTVRWAAEYMGVSVEAVRGRIKRGTLEHEKAPDGTVYVLLDTDQLQPVGGKPGDQSLLMIRLENEIEFLRRELERKDAILLRMAERIPKPPPPKSEAARAYESSMERAARSRDVASDAQELLQGPWWHRIQGV
jgi:hypothetical protein